MALLCLLMQFGLIKEGEKKTQNIFIIEKNVTII